jgi:hypothetical protein
MSLPEEQSPFKEPLCPIGKRQLGLAASFVKPSQKIGDKGGNQFIDEETFINERKPSSTTVEKEYLNKSDHTLIPVTTKIHSTVYECKRFVLKDGHLLQYI